MNKNVSYLDSNWLLKYTVIVIGFLIMVIGINGFLKPANMLSGGVSGVAIAINYLTDINMGILVTVINIPIFILGFKFLDKQFCVTSAINVLILSLLLGITQDIEVYIKINDIFLQMVYGGLLNGIGMGLVFKAKSSAGGIDILAAILKIEKNISMKNTFLFINTFVVILGGVLFGVNMAMYTLISIFISTNAMNVIKNSFNSQKAILVISEKYEEIAKDIMDDLGRGVTFIEAEGAYTHDKKKMIYCLALSNEIPRIKNISLKYDKNSFISVNDLDEVKGRGFKDKFL